MFVDKRFMIRGGCCWGNMNWGTVGSRSWGIWSWSSWGIGGGSSCNKRFNRSWGRIRSRSWGSSCHIRSRSWCRVNIRSRGWVGYKGSRSWSNIRSRSWGSVNIWSRSWGGMDIRSRSWVIRSRSRCWMVRSWGRVIRSRCRMVGLRTSVTFPSMTRDTGLVITGSKILIKSGSVTAVECVLLAIFVTEMIDLIIVTRLVTYK